MKALFLRIILFFALLRISFFSFFLKIFKSTMHSHRSSTKQQNKGFKSKHASKGSIKKLNKGKVNRASVKRKDVTKEQKRNQLKAVQQAKRQILLETQRLFNGYS
jgi:pre-rRNA-processing protein TSR1